MILRDYQQECCDAIMAEFESVGSTLAVMPTGAGKTVCFAEIIRRFYPRRAIVLAHRAELIYQAKEKIEFTTGLQCDIEMADLAASANLFTANPIIVSTIQTQTSGPEGRERMTRFKPEDYGLLIIDEAHHGLSDSYRKVIDYYRQNESLRVLGVTATPDRADEKALGQIFETVAFDYEIIDAIHNGYLVPIDQQFVTVHDLDFSAVRTTAGDLNGADLAAVMERERTMQEVAAASIDIIGNKRTIIFTASVAQAETLTNILNRHRPNMAGFVCGATDKDSRQNLLKSFSSCQTQVVVNCAVLSEGFDNPGIEIVIMARPTKSRSLYAQQIGRGTRPLPNVIDGLETAEERKAAIENSAKKSLLVVDFVGNSGRHKLMTSADILGGRNSEEAVAVAKAKAKKEGKNVRMSDLLDEAEEELKEKRRLEEEARKLRLVAKSNFSSVAISPFDRFNVKKQEPSRWERQNGIFLSEKQRNIVRKIGVDPDQISVSCARKLIGAFFERGCSEGQAKVLRRFGYSPDNYNVKTASALIDKIAKNGWRPLPEEEPSNEPERFASADEMAPG